MKEIIRKTWDFITSPITKLSERLIKNHLYKFETIEESNRFLGFALVTIIMSFVVYFTGNTDLGWALLFGGGQVYSFIHEFFNCKLYDQPYRPNLGFLGIIGLAIGGILAGALYMVIFGFGGAIIDLFK